jgi:hypothetical protein
MVPLSDGCAINEILLATGDCLVSDICHDTAARSRYGVFVLQ